MTIITEDLTDSCKKYEVNPNKTTVAPIKPIIVDTANNVPVDDKSKDTSNESTALVKVD